MIESEPRFTDIFAQELCDRLRWFVRLRWLAVVGLATASFAGPRIGLPATWPSLFVIAVSVALYNVLFLVFNWRLRIEEDGHDVRRRLSPHAILQMVTDLAALTATVYFTGGLTGPLLVFFAFHMAIGTMMIATRLMYVLASLTSLGLLGVYLAELGSLLPHQSIDDAATGWESASAVNLLALVVSMYGIIYLTNSVTSRFKQRNIELFQTSQALRERTREMERAEQGKSHYMRISAHQLRSPLATVRTSLQVLTESYVELDSARALKLVRGSMERVDGLLAIVNDLLDLAKIREGRGRSSWNRSVDVRELLAKELEIQTPHARKREVNLVADLQQAPPLEWGITTDLHHIFENLIGNAIKYSNPQGEVTVQLRTRNQSVVLEVADQGIGIPEVLLDQVFLEFVRTPEAKRHAEGTGLGLSIVKEAAEAHGGTVSVESREGEGSRFTVKLPLGYTPREVVHLGDTHVDSSSAG